MYTYKIKIKKVKGFITESTQSRGMNLTIKSSKKLTNESLFKHADEYLNEKYGVRLVEAVKTENGKISGNRLVNPDPYTMRRLGISREERNTAKVPTREIYKSRKDGYKPTVFSKRIADDGYKGEKKKMRTKKWGDEKENRYSIKYVFDYAIVENIDGDFPRVVASGHSEDWFKKTPNLLSDILTKYGLQQIAVGKDTDEPYEKYNYIFDDKFRCIDIKNAKSFDKKNSLRGIKIKKDDNYVSNYTICYRVMPFDYYMDYEYDTKSLVDWIYDDIEWNESGTVGRRLDRDCYDDDCFVTSDYRYDADSDSWVGDDYPEY